MDGTHVVQGFLGVPLPKKFNFSGNWTIRSGTRFNIITGRDTNGDGSYNERPAYSSDPAKPGVIATKYGLLDPSPLPGSVLIPRNLGRGPTTIRFDAYLSRSFKLGGKKPVVGNAANAGGNSGFSPTIGFNIQARNLFNINNKNTPIGNMSSLDFLRSISGPSYNGGFDASSPRSISFGTSFSF